MIDKYGKALRFDQSIDTEIGLHLPKKNICNAG